ncbi:hypothetical protein AGLY_017158 [Aphis glycines]|uniref:PiggyBac transposable element-derived protein domain-containing protein n=1 Tax=Aphis glycines TaxID=307491 RepID=A0A6G0SVP4_APHGL|nr:hypothetical protein AGLY_017158 [Aphis glycines]
MFIPVFVFAVMLNFYHFDSIFSKEVSIKFDNCKDCFSSTCYNISLGWCNLHSDNITAECYVCSKEDGNQQYYTIDECFTYCSMTKCYCDGLCYKCVEDNTDTSKFTCRYTLSLCLDHSDPSGLGDLEITLISLIRLNNLTIQDLIFSFVFCENTNLRTQKILAMIPLERSESSGNESSDEHVDYASNYDSSSSSLSANANENELDELLKNFELNPIDEATREFFDSIDENIIEEEISTTNFSPTFPSTSGTSPLPETEFVSPQPSTSAAMSSKSKQLSTRTSKRILNYNVRTPSIPLPSSQPSTLPEAQFVSPRSSRKYNIEHMQFKWKSEKQFNFGVEIPNYEFHTNNKEALTPYVYFKRFFSDDIFDLIVQEKEGNRYSIDEMMIPYKGWNINGQVFDILPYGGESKFTDIKFTEYENKYFGLGGKVILALASTIPRKPLLVIYYDIFFTSPELIYHLRKKYGILSLGTVQQNHLRNSPLLDEKKFTKKR